MAFLLRLLPVMAGLLVVLSFPVYSATRSDSLAPPSQLSAGGGPVYVAKLDVSPSYLGSSEAAIGIVTLSKITSADAVIRLRHNRPDTIQMPDKLVVPAGKSSAMFTVSVKDARDKAERIVSVGAEYGGWIQAQTLTVVPVAPSRKPGNLDAHGGNGCVVLSWRNLPDGAVERYHIYRRLAGTAAHTELPSCNGTLEFYADAEAENNKEYEYRVIPQVRGQEDIQAASEWVRAKTNSSAPTVRWDRFHFRAAGVVTHTISFQAEDKSSYRLFSVVDGKLFSGVGYRGPDDVVINTEYLQNGEHTIQIVGIGKDFASATRPRIFVVDNPPSEFYFKCDSFLRVADNGLVTIEGDLPKQTASWSVKIIEKSGKQVVYTKSGNGDQSLRFAWDGRDKSGNVVSGGMYDVEVTVNGPYGTHTRRLNVYVAAVP